MSHSGVFRRFLCSYSYCIGPNFIFKLLFCFGKGGGGETGCNLLVKLIGVLTKYTCLIFPAAMLVMIVSGMCKPLSYYSCSECN